MNSALRRWSFVAGGLLSVGALGLGAQGAGGADESPCAPSAPAMAAPSAAAAATEPHFVKLAAFDFLRLLPAPPAPDSPVARGELIVVRQVQAWRTPEQEAWAKVVDNDCVFNLAEALGPWFLRRNLPRTESFFKMLGDDLRFMDRASKQPFARPRPGTVDPSIKPCVRIPTSTSYPSGSAMQAYLWAELMAEIFPERRSALEARAQRAAWGRVLGGVHYPSDLAAGQMLVAPFLAECRKNPAFVERWAECAGELRAAAATK